MQIKRRDFEDRRVLIVEVSIDREWSIEFHKKDKRLKMFMWNPHREVYMNPFKHVLPRIIGADWHWLINGSLERGVTND